MSAAGGMRRFEREFARVVFNDTIASISNLSGMLRGD